jgi:hypothetical protein
MHQTIQNKRQNVRVDHVHLLQREQTETLEKIQQMMREKKALIELLPKNNPLTETVDLQNATQNCR